MELELDRKELELLTDLVERRASELHPEIRRTMDHNYKDDLKRDLECLVALLERLRSLGNANE